MPSSIRPGGLTPLPRISGFTLLLPYFEQDNRYDVYDQSKNWNAAENRLAVNQRIPVLECPSSPRPERLDGLPEATPWEAGIGAPTDYAATIYVDQRLESAGLVDKAGTGMLERNARPTLAAVTDGLSNTIMYAESAGRPYLYRQGKLVSEDLTQARVNGGAWCRPATEISIDGSTKNGEVLPGPCAINCTNGEDFASGPFPHPYYGSFGSGEAYAFHSGGANFAFGDGSVHFLSDDMDIREFAPPGDARRWRSRTRDSLVLCQLEKDGCKVGQSQRRPTIYWLEKWWACARCASWAHPTCLLSIPEAGAGTAERE